MIIVAFLESVFHKATNSLCCSPWYDNHFLWHICHWLQSHRPLERSLQQPQTTLKEGRSRPKRYYFPLEAFQDCCSGVGALGHSWALHLRVLLFRLSPELSTGSPCDHSHYLNSESSNNCTNASLSFKQYWPLINPLIYSLRNKGVNKAFQRPVRRCSDGFQTLCHIKRKYAYWNMFIYH